MATKRKMRKLKIKSKSRKSLRKIRSRSRSKSRKYRGGCTNCMKYHGSGSPAPEWNQGAGSQSMYKGGSNENLINDDIFKHSTDPSFYSSTN